MNCWLRRIFVVKHSPGTENALPETVASNVLVLSQDCEIDKAIKRRTSVSVACVFDLASLPRDNHKPIRENRAFNYFYLPIEPPFPVEGCIDWRTVQPVDISALIAIRDTDRYICTLSDDLLKAASERFWDFYFRPMEFNRRGNPPAPQDAPGGFFNRLLKRWR